MSRILEKEEFEKIIYDYYLEHYGEQETDVCLESPAVNVRTFLRDGKYITLKSHILTGEIEVHIE